MAETIGRERYVKFLIELRTGAIHYLDARAFAVHADFVLAELTPRWRPHSRLLEPLARLYNRWRVRQRLATYDRNYGQEKPELLLGTLVHHLDADLHAIALWEGDLASARDVRRCYEKVRETFYRGTDLRFRPNSTRQERLLADPLLSDVPSITNDVLYREAPYQLFAEGVAVGRLRIVGSVSSGRPRFATDEIVVLGEILLDLTPVRGVISEHFCTPLSHVALRARAWRIPHAGIKEASARYASLDGRWVYFEARREGAVLREATLDEIEAASAQAEKRRALELPPPDRWSRDVRPLSELRAADGRAYGAKAANLGEIARAGRRSLGVPPGFALPVAHYAEHLDRHGLWKQVDALLADERAALDPEHRAARLEALRREIRERPMAAALERAIADHLDQMGGAARDVFVRSSTNAEDLPGLSGAGLYDSIPNVRDVAEVVDAVKRVWASIWNERAFDERAFWGLDHRAVYGGALVLAAVDATAAGVLVTADLFGGSDRVLTINAKRGPGVGVVEGTSVPEQILYDRKEGGIKVVSRADAGGIVVPAEDGGVREVRHPGPGAPVLSEDQVRALVRAAEEIERILPVRGPLDIEFVFDGEHLHVVQARPYVV